MEVVELEQPGPLLDAVYREVLAPSFAPAELVTLDELATGLRDGGTSVTAVFTDPRPPAAGRPVAAVVGDWSPASRVQLLSYLAVLPLSRGTGIGGRLLGQASGAWQRRRRPCVILAEVEHPAAHQATEEYGDPAARLRFYAGHGATALDLPYFQPALRPETGRYYGMILLCLHLDPELAGSAPGTVATAPLHTFLTRNLAGAEGAGPPGGGPADPAVDRLLAALDRPAGIPMLAIERVDELPVSAPG
jgi:GNAT superfamily N-acetyltransferase